MHLTSGEPRGGSARRLDRKQKYPRLSKYPYGTHRSTLYPHLADGEYVEDRLTAAEEGYHRTEPSRTRESAPGLRTHTVIRLIQINE